MMNRIITLTLIALLLGGCATNITSMTEPNVDDSGAYIGDTKLIQRSISIGGKQRGKGNAEYDWDQLGGKLTINGDATQDGSLSPENAALLLKLLTP